MSTRAPSSTQLGLTLRSVLLSPAAGFTAALRTASRRERTGRRADGVAHQLLAALGGAALLLLWLKLSALAGIRQIGAPQYQWGYLVAAALLGAVIGLLAQRAWASIVARSTPASAAHLRLIWGAAAFPQVLALVLLLPLDLLIVGPATFTSEPLSDPLAMTWVSLSIALWLSLTVWSLYLLFRGVQVAGAKDARTAVSAVALALAAVALITAGFFVLSLLVPTTA